MAETVVEFVLNELFQVLKEEFNLQTGVKKELESVKDELESIRAFLKYNIEANKLKYLLQDLEAWVKQVRDVAFEIEDVVDEFLIRFANRLRNDNDDDHGSPHKKITCVASNISSSIRNWKFNHRIGSELRSIKTKVEKIADYSPALPSQGSSSVLRSKVIGIDGSEELVGIEEPKKKLMELLSYHDSELEVIAIVGVGGLGKTTLANEIYNDIKFEFGSRAFVTISQSFKQEELLKDLAQQLFFYEKDVLKEIHTMSILGLKEKMMNLLQHRRYLIVLDDVWEKGHWDNLTTGIMPKNDFGSRVVLTTRKEEVARYAIATFDFRGQVYYLPFLSQANSWRRCGGLPLAILTLSGVLVTKNKLQIEEWEMVLNILNIRGGPKNPDYNMLDRVLSLGFDDLPYCLKPCFLSLSIFPEDHLIKPMRLVRLWISEGLMMREKDYGSTMTLEEIAKSYLYQLVDRSLIQTVESTIDGRIVFCRVHDLLHETALRKCREEQGLLEVIKSDQENNNATKWPERVRRLSIHRYHDGEFEHVVRSILPSRLRSLFLFQSHTSTMSKFLGSGGFKLLNVLDMRGAPLEMFPETISKLFLLKYLSLRDTKISSLPGSIGNLQSLETLDLKHTYITEVPSVISNLHKLRHLLICHYEEMDHPIFSQSGDYLIRDIQRIPIPDISYGVKMKFLPCKRRQQSTLKKLHQLHGFKATPTIIRSLVSLQTLCIVEACDDDDEFIKALGRLTQLRRLSLVNLKGKHWSALCSSISKLRNLHSLLLHTNQEFDLEGLRSPPPLLQRLYLNGKLVKLPNWLSSLHKLQVLHLVGTQLIENPSQCLQNLPSLVFIGLYNALAEWRLSMSNVAFQRLNIGVADLVEVHVGRNEYVFFSNGKVGLDFEGSRAFRELYGFGGEPSVLEIMHEDQSAIMKIYKDIPNL
ncbi:disease resistance protein RPM1-like [Senna tora]|uniref:Disease resistance protein RPM1-like n=1 Tax=Senna tora TaxID=362788 RepID=A0A834W7L2_9FABA|nr:disease resistance protein RPM1-like [Senna tora]